MNSTVKNTYFDNLVNYEVNQSSSSNPKIFNYNSIDPTCLSNLLKDQQIIEYHLIETIENQMIKKEEPLF